MASTSYDVLLLFAPPGSAKSHHVSVAFPPWWMAQNPQSSVIAASHGSELASKWGRRVRNLISSNSATLGVSLAEDSQAADRWALSQGGEYMAAGVQAGISGFRADLGIIDDPFGSKEDAYSARVRDRVWEWYINDFSNRLKPNAKRVIMHCMVGDTPVLMADASSKALRDVQPGDMVATFEDGTASTSKVLNWANQGPDLVYEIRMISGITVKANERHPFLVARAGELHWTKLRNLRAGDILLSLTEHGAGKSAVTQNVSEKSAQKGCAARITTRRDGLRGTKPAPARNLAPSSAIATASERTSTTHCLPRKADVAPFVGNPLKTLVLRPHGRGDLVSITATKPSGCEDFYAIRATSSLETLTLSTPRSVCASPLSTYVATYDAIASIAPAGREDVFDIQVENTENFIANGLVSHNTRWHEDDLAGRVILQAKQNDQQVRIVSIPAIAEEDDALGRQPGEYLWDEPAGYDYASFLRKRQVETPPQEWAALFQQHPVPEGGGYFKKEWLKYYDAKPNNLRTYGASDYAVTDKGGDFTEHGVAGIDPDSNLYLLDWWRGQTASDVWVDMLIDMAARHSPLSWAEENGQIIKSLGPFIEQRMRERNVNFWREQFTSVADKPTRAQGIRGRMALGKVYFPRNASWVADLVAQLLSFPAGKHDDGVDVLSLFGRLLDQMFPPETSPQEFKVKRHGGGWQSA